MLILSVLITSALVTVVCSIFVTGAQWLLALTAVLIGAAFYCSRRSARQHNDHRRVIRTSGSAAISGAKQYDPVSVDPEMLVNLYGRHRADLDAAELEAMKQKMEQDAPDGAAQPVPSAPAAADLSQSDAV